MKYIFFVIFIIPNVLQAQQKISEEDFEVPYCVFPKSNANSKSTEDVHPIPSDVNISMLESYPTSEYVIYIDYDGEVVSGDFWNDRNNDGQDIICAPSGLSDEAIYAIWQIVSEDYKPFNINVTTRRDVYDAVHYSKSQMLIITESSSWYSNTSKGVGRFWSFKNNTSPCFVFSNKFGSWPNNIGGVSSHELGHAFGLHHDGSSSTSYYQGHGMWNTIMGGNFSKKTTQFSKGEYEDANNTEDDLFIITETSGLPYKNDDHGSVIESATLLLGDGENIEEQNNNGVIERSTDVDYFSFYTSGGLIDLKFTGAVPKPNLNIKVTLYDEGSQELVLSDIPNEVYASIQTTVSEGRYYLKIEGVGEADPLTNGYSDYASLGYYGIEGTVENLDNSNPKVSFLAPQKGNTIQMRPFRVVELKVKASDVDGTIKKVEFEIEEESITANKEGEFYVAYWIPDTYKTYLIKAKVVDDEGKQGHTVINVNVADLSTQYDVTLVEVDNIKEEVCGLFIEPNLRVKNEGIQKITSLTSEIYVDDNLEYTSTNVVDIPAGATKDVLLEIIDLGTEGNHNLKYVIKSPNSEADENVLDNEITQTVDVVNGVLYDFYVANQSKLFTGTWEIINEDVTVLSSLEVSNANNTTLTDSENIYTFCLLDGCYDIVVKDMFDYGNCIEDRWNQGIEYFGGQVVSLDGIKYQAIWSNINDFPVQSNSWEDLGPCSMPNATDTYGLRKSGNKEQKYVEVEVQEYVSPRTDAFCVDNVITGEHAVVEKENYKVYPNPVNDVVKIRGEKIESIVLINSVGETLRVSKSQSGEYVFDLSFYASGVFILKIYSQHEVSIRKIYKY